MSRTARVCARLSLGILCLTPVLVIIGFVVAVLSGQALFSGDGIAGAISALGGTAWLVLPPIGLLLAIPGLRAPRPRPALTGIIGNCLLLLSIPGTFIIGTLILGP